MCVVVVVACCLLLLRSLFVVCCMLLVGVCIVVVVLVVACCCCLLVLLLFVEEQLVDFGVVSPGPRRALNFVNNRRWFDNEQDRSPAAERMYVDELREFRAYLVGHTDITELKSLNLLGVQFALCEASKSLRVRPHLQTELSRFRPCVTRRCVGRR